MLGHEQRAIRCQLPSDVGVHADKFCKLVGSSSKLVAQLEGLPALHEAEVYAGIAVVRVVRPIGWGKVKRG